MRGAPRHYYNDIDQEVAEWARELIRRGELPPGDVDTRSITEVHPSDLRGYTQCHFFCGILGWPLALKLAGWPADKPCWTGSPPCQGFSSAGAGRGFEDERHLWPVFFRLIEACQPDVVFGEQVASSLVVGKSSSKKLTPAGLDAAVADQHSKTTWIDLLQADLEAASYASIAADLPSAGFGAPHIRQRIMFAAERLRRVQPCRAHGIMGDSECEGLERLGGHVNEGNQPGRLGAHKAGPASEAGSVGWVADANCLGHDARLAGDEGAEDGSRGEHRDGTSGRSCDGWSSATSGFWSDPDWLFCRDGKWRPVEPGSFPLVDGIPASLVERCDGGVSRTQWNALRKMTLKGYGNAINPHQGAAFISAYMEAAGLIIEQ